MLNGCLHLKRETRRYIYILMEVHNAISKMVFGKIKPESDKKFGPINLQEIQGQSNMPTISVKSRRDFLQDK